MVNAQEVRASALIEKTAEKLKEQEQLEQPNWSKHVKTGVDREKRPQDPDWWYKRTASLLRKIYLNEPQGVETLRSWYGGRKNKGRVPEKHAKASGKIIRTALQQLEDAGYLEKTKEGRRITSQGTSLLDKTALEIKNQNSDEND